ESVTMLDVFDLYDNQHKDRYFWSNNRADFCYVGIGAAKEIISQDGGIQMVQEEWSTLINQAEIHNPYHFPGTGMVAVGGMAFDSIAVSSMHWMNYPPAKLVVPEKMIVNTKGRYFLIVNGYLDEGTF